MTVLRSERGFPDALQMGKSEEQNLHQQQSHEAENRASSGLICAGCSMVLRRLAKGFSFRCVLVLFMSLSVLLSGIFWIIPHHVMKSGFDAKEAIRLSGISSFICFLLSLFLLAYLFATYVFIIRAF